MYTEDQGTKQTGPSQYRMAGSGVALRLHEFKDIHDTNHQPKHIAQRQGRDVQGLYPGQLARVHTFSTHLYRSTLKTLDLWCNESAVEENHQRSFDLLTLQALLVSSHGGTMDPRATPKSYTLDTHHTHLSTYRMEFSSPARLHGPDVHKFTLSSHPNPLDVEQDCGR